MNIEKQVCTLDQAKKLRALGVMAPAFFMWYFDWQDEFKMKLVAYRVPGIVYHGAEKKEVNCWAYSAAELGVMIIANDDTHFPQVYYNEHSGTWESNILKREDVEGSAELMPITEAMQESEYEAETKADTLIYMLENGITTPEICAARLAE